MACVLGPEAVALDETPEVPDGASQFNSDMRRPVLRDWVVTSGREDSFPP
jgi:hypothetical protein